MISLYAVSEANRNNTAYLKCMDVIDSILDKLEIEIEDKPLGIFGLRRISIKTSYGGEQNTTVYYIRHIEKSRCTLTA